MQIRVMFKLLNVTVANVDSEIQDIILKNSKDLPRFSQSFKTSNGSMLDVSFSTNRRQETVCSVGYWQRSWRYVKTDIILP